MTIREIEEQLKIPRANIRYYEKEGLLHPARSANNYRVYSEEDVETLRKIALLRRLDIPVETIRAVQAGEIPLPDALARQAGLLEGEAARVDTARSVCQTMLAEGVTYPALDPARYEAAPAPLPSPASPGRETPRPPVENAAWAFDPWQRYWARMLDLALASFLAWAALTLGFRLPILRLSGTLVRLLVTVLGWGLTFLLEPLLLSTWGTTPGKWLLGLELRDKRGGKLSFREALERTGGVLSAGFGFTIPFYSLYRLYRSYQTCRENQPMDYDRYMGFLYYSKTPSRWGWRAVVSVALTLALIPAEVLCALHALLPPNRGDLTPAAYAENVNSMAKSLGYSLWIDGEGYRLSTSTYSVEENGTWTEHRYGEPYEDAPIYTVETDGEGFVTAVVFAEEAHFSREEDGWVILPLWEIQAAVAAFRGARCGGWDLLRGEIMETLASAPAGWDGEPIEEGAFVLTCSLEAADASGMAGGSIFLQPLEEAEGYWYRYVVRVALAE